jgi:hypothetical protein
VRTPQLKSELKGGRARQPGRSQAMETPIVDAENTAVAPVAAREVLMKVKKKYGDKGCIYPGTLLMADQEWVISDDEEFVLIMQSDGNLVLYRVIGPPPQKFGDQLRGRDVWSSGTVTVKRGHRFAFQTDSNLVIYMENNQPVWQAQTYNPPGDPIKLEVVSFSEAPMGNFRLYKSVIVWNAMKP